MQLLGGLMLFSLDHAEFVVRVACRHGEKKVFAGAVMHLPQRRCGSVGDLRIGVVERRAETRDELRVLRFVGSGGAGQHRPRAIDGRRRQGSLLGLYSGKGDETNDGTKYGGTQPDDHGLSLEQIPCCWKPDNGVQYRFSGEKRTLTSPLRSTSTGNWLHLL